MRTAFSVLATFLSALSVANGQTFTSCHPTQKSCPADPALGGTLETDFTKGASQDWTLADGTSLSYNDNGANFVISQANDAPTISSTKYIFFGRISAVVRAAPGSGIVSSVILQSDDLDEIDWEWIGSEDTSVQTNFFGKGNTTNYDRSTINPVTNPVEDWHTYTLDWTSSAMKWYVDGNLIRTVNYGDALALNGRNYPQTPMRVKIGNWVGCADQAAASNPSTSGTCDWAGGPADWSNAPFTMLVKSITVQDYSCATEYEYGDMSGSYQSIKSIGTCGGSTTTPISTQTTKASPTTSSSTHHSTTETPTTTTTSTTTTTTTTTSSSTHYSETEPANTESKTTQSSIGSATTAATSASITFATTGSDSSTSSDGQDTATTSGATTTDATTTITPTTTDSTGSCTTYPTTAASTGPYYIGNATTVSSPGSNTIGTGFSYPSGYNTAPGGSGSTTFSVATTTTTSSQSSTSTSSATISATIHPGGAQSLRSPRILDLNIFTLFLGVIYLIL